MEGLQETTLTPRVTRHTGQGTIKQGGRHWRQGRLCPHESQEWQREGCHASQTHPVKPEPNETPFHYWNQDTLSHWLGPENLGWALVDGVRTRVLLDNGARVTPAYIHQHKLKVGSIEALDHSMNPYD